MKQIDYKSTKSFSEQIAEKANIFNKVNKAVENSKLAEKTLRTQKTAKTLKNEQNFDTIIKRRTAKESEQDFYKENLNYTPQVSFINRKEVTYAKKGSSRVDAYKPGEAVEIKNYTLSKKQNQYNMVRTLVKQFEKRKINLPEGTKQTAVIDIRGQRVPKEVLKEIKKKINIYDKVKVKRR